NIINELDIIEGLLRKAVAENAHKAMDQDDYNKRYNQMVDRYKLAQAELSKVEKMKQERKYQKESIINFIRKLKNQEMLLDEFDEDL
ncbi:MAG: hypothetical protein Q7I98_04505, partial [Erysipelotrichaceae bacterium]|nr:hypothetical protein [Erysipelotrichaceae bacterium]